MRKAKTWEFREGRLDSLYRVLEKRPKTLGELLEAFNLKFEEFPRELNLNSRVLLSRMEGSDNRLTYAYILDNNNLYDLFPLYELEFDPEQNKLTPAVIRFGYSMKSIKA